MRLRLFGLRKARGNAGVLTAIYVAPAAGALMQSRDAVDVAAGKGLVDDRYADGRGYYRHTDACPVTMIDGAALSRIERRTGIRLMHGEHRRNLIVEGLSVRDLGRGTILRVGALRFAVDRARPPCGYLERLTEPGMVRALARDAGICLRPEDGGTIRVGERVTIE